MRAEASILHIDLDAFFASVEQRDKPSLRGRPVVVGGLGNRGVVATASYEARAYGVHSAMSMTEARSRCPHAAFLTGRFDVYRRTSAAVMRVLRDLSPVVEPLSLDEAFVDLRASRVGDFGVPALTAAVAELKQRVHRVTGGLHGSVGVATSKLVAKIASDLDKPDGLVVVPAGTERALLRPMQVSVIPGVGPATAERLRRVGVQTVEQLERISEDELVRLVGTAHGHSLYRLCRADDDRPVLAVRESKSVSVEDTFETDLVDPALLGMIVARHADQVCQRLRKAKLSGRTITVKVRLHDFTTHTRSATLPGPTDDPRVVARLARRLVTEVDTSAGVRLLGVGVSALADWIQDDLFGDAAGGEESGAGSADLASPAARESQRGPAGDAGERAPASWVPGSDVVHAEHGAGWVWGAGLGRVTVRFETAATGPGPVRTLRADDPGLSRRDSVGDMDHAAALTPPAAKQVRHLRTHHGDTVVDPYDWLRDKDSADTVAYLEAENAYTEQQTARLAGLRDRIFTEIKTRTQETDLSVPSRVGDWWYYSRTVEGQQYALHCRTAAEPGDWTPPTPEPGADLPGEQVMLDGNELAEGREFFSLGALSVSIDGHLLAYSTDYVGDERYTLRVKDLRTGDLLPDVIDNVLGSATWDRAGTHLFYTTVDETWRPDKVWRHRLGTDAADDVVVYEEADPQFWLDVGRTRSDRFLVIASGSRTTTEYRVLDADDPCGSPRVVAARRPGVEYHLEHAVIGGEDRFLLLHNDHALDFELAEAPVDDATPGNWRPVIPHLPGTRLESVEAFRGHLVVSLRSHGMTGLRIIPIGGDGFEAPYDVEFDEPIYTTGTAGNPEFDQPTVRFAYTSMVTPPAVYDFDVRTRQRMLLKQTPVLGGFASADYEQHREWATAPDGTQIPISIVCRKGTAKDGRNPALISGYGSYEHSSDPVFSIPRLSLLDRGMVVALAHVRGGGELGRRWYDEGKLLAKKNTFTDFVACARHLAQAGWTAPDRLVAQGGSAGGLLVGAAANLAPEAFAGILAEVPFVDPLTSILDPSLPLTVLEWEEWGNPLEDPAVYAYMKSYSPYENVAAKDYPAILAVTSLNDTRVLYVEPAKWVARLRATSTGGSPVLLKTEMEAGHGGRSGRYNAWQQRAFAYAWVVDIAGAPVEPQGRS